jgi:hypothetical protein
LGRPTLRTPEIEALILGALRTGGSLRHAAQIAGITRQTLDRWRASDEAFSARLDQARAQAIADVRGALHRLAIEGNVAACQFFLSRRCPDFQEGGALADLTDDEAKKFVPRVVQVQLVEPKAKKEASDG